MRRIKYFRTNKAVVLSVGASVFGVLATLFTLTGDSAAQTINVDNINGGNNQVGNHNNQNITVVAPNEDSKVRYNEKNVALDSDGRPVCVESSKQRVEQKPSGGSIWHNESFYVCKTRAGSVEFRYLPVDRGWGGSWTNGN